MRILFANDGIGDAGGVNTYVIRVLRGLMERGQDVALLHYDRRRPGDMPCDLTDLRCFGVLDDGEKTAWEQATSWAPDLCYSNNMGLLDLERRLLDCFPVVKFMHGYFGTCISNLKMHAFPFAAPCDRRLGAGCLAMYVPCRCGPLSWPAMREGYAWASRQQSLFARYAAIVVASQHMRREYVRNGAVSDRVVVNPLFAPRRGLAHLAESSGQNDLAPLSVANILFVGRMTHLKGGDVLIRAAAQLQQRLGKQCVLNLVGDGPQRTAWERLAGRLNLTARFAGWIADGAIEEFYRNANVLVVPSVWPEPFGLIGLEAARFGVPAVAFDVGGISEWLVDGVNGVLVRGKRPNAVALAEALYNLLTDPNRLAALQRGALAVAERMSFDAHLDRLEETFVTCRASLRVL